MRMGSSNTPPPKPVMPIRVPTRKPTRIFSSNIGLEISRSSPALLLVVANADIPFALQMKNNLLGSFFRAHSSRVDGHVGLHRNLVRIGNPRELLEDTRA